MACPQRTILGVRLPHRFELVSSKPYSRTGAAVTHPDTYVLRYRCLYCGGERVEHVDHCRAVEKGVTRGREWCGLGNMAPGVGERSR